MTFRATLKANKLPTNARGIGPDEFKDKVKEKIKSGMLPSKAAKIVESELASQQVINDRFNRIAVELGDELISKLKDVDITWCKDGCIVISADNSIAEIERVMEELNLEIQPDKSDIKHKVKNIDPEDPESESEEDIDEVFEPKTAGELKKIKSRSVENKYKLKKVLKKG